MATKMVRIKAKTTYRGVLGHFEVGEEFDREAMLRKEYESRVGHFEVVDTFEKPDIELVPPPLGVVRVDLVREHNMDILEDDMRLVKWDGDHNVEYCGHIIRKGTELVIPKDWLTELVKNEGWKQLRNKFRKVE